MGAYVAGGGEFKRDTNYITTRITADGADGYASEPGRYRLIYTEVNNGVYRCGFAGSQESYEAAYDRLFVALEWLSERLADQRYLVGDTITEAGIR